MYIETNRLMITEFTLDMAEDVHLNSLDDDTRKYLPDEVFETKEEALETLEYLIQVYKTGDGPLVYPVLLKDGTNIGYVQAVPLNENEWEIGYHIAKAHTCKGYASEAVQAFLPVFMTSMNLNEIKGITVLENIASIHVLENCRFTKCFEGTGHYQGQDRVIVSYLYQKGQ